MRHDRTTIFDMDVWHTRSYVQVKYDDVNRCDTGARCSGLRRTESVMDMIQRMYVVPIDGSRRAVKNDVLCMRHLQRIAEI